ncbi:MAG: hypothetical protein JSR90_17660 [Proteobacteria bacterium]|nr:hypothetical protein [Pseudomonadota bacterium]
MAHDLDIMEATVTYCCPNTGRAAEATIDLATDDAHQYQPHFCLACRKIHLINCVTGRLLGEKSLVPASDVH